jgi:NitT/TauT family transport system permease protein
MALDTTSLASQEHTRAAVAEDRRRLSRTHPPYARVALRWLAALVPGIVVIALWQILTQAQVVAAFLLPAPGVVLRSFWQGFADGLLRDATLSTIGESLLGFVLGAAIALPLGYLVARSRMMAWLIEPYIAMSQALPAVALAPLLVLWLGYGLLPIVLLCALIVFFPITIATILGLRTIDRDVLAAASVDGANWWTKLWYIEAPLALPSILSGVRAGLTYSITGAVVGEFVISAQGLGGLLMIARGNFDTPLVFATLLALGLLAAIMYGIGRLIERCISYIEIS